jgi:aromatic-L-amino-acid/L-tryptophan decarboxylase
LATLSGATTRNPAGELAALCSAEGLWFDVDGAYGAAAVLTPAGRSVVAGIERADSLVIDPHKWLFQPTRRVPC